MHGAPHTFCLMLWSLLQLALSNHNDNKSSVTPRNTTWSSSIANPLERSIGGWRQKALLPLTPLTCEKKRNYVEYQYWLWTNKTLKTAQWYSSLVNTTTYTRTSPGVMSIHQHSLMGAQNYWRLVWPITMKMRSSTRNSLIFTPVTSPSSIELFHV